MKKLILLILATIILYSCAIRWTQVSFDNGFIKVYDVEGTSDELFLKANSWMVNTFKDASSVIQHSDKVEGVLLGRYLMHGIVSAGIYGTVNDSRIFAVIDIRVKNGKARISIQPEPFRYHMGMVGNEYVYTKEKAIADMENLSTSFYDALKKEAIKF